MLGGVLIARTAGPRGAGSPRRTAMRLRRAAVLPGRLCAADPAVRPLTAARLDALMGPPPGGDTLLDALARIGEPVPGEARGVRDSAWARGAVAAARGPREQGRDPLPRRDPRIPADRVPRRGGRAVRGTGPDVTPTAIPERVLRVLEGPGGRRGRDGMPSVRPHDGGEGSRRRRGGGEERALHGPGRRDEHGEDGPAAYSARPAARALEHFASSTTGGVQAARTPVVPGTPLADSLAQPPATAPDARSERLAQPPATAPDARPERGAQRPSTGGGPARALRSGEGDRGGAAAGERPADRSGRPAAGLPGSPAAAPPAQTGASLASAGAPLRDPVPASGLTGLVSWWNGGTTPQPSSHATRSPEQDPTAPGPLAARELADAVGRLFVSEARRYGIEVDER